MKLKYGNCLTGAVFLLWKERANQPSIILKRRPGTVVPHFMVRSSTGLHHFRNHKDTLPWPLCYILFEGRFQTVQPGDESDYDKHSSFWRLSRRA